MELLTELITFITLVVGSMTAAFFISKSWWYQKFKASIITTPLNAPSNNSDAMGLIKEAIPSLNINEKEQIITLCFGRSCKFAKVVTPEGYSYLDAAMVEGYEPEETDNNAAG